jgi:hypothetical protein
MQNKDQDQDQPKKQSGVYERLQTKKNKSRVYEKTIKPYRNYENIINPYSNRNLVNPYNLINPYNNLGNSYNNIPVYAQTPPVMNVFPQNISSHPINPIPVIPVPGPFPVFANYQPEINKIIKNKYDIKVSHTDLNGIRHIYQDLLPKPINPELGHFALIIDRLNIYEYFETVFGSNYSNNPTNDITTPSNQNLEFLFGRIKINGYNSYYTDSNDTVLSSMIRAPPNFFMFNICYPIFVNNNNIECDHNSQKGNMRVYNIVNGGTISSEIKYYEKIKDIIQNNQCPNFVLSYGMIVGNYTIDWNTIAYMTNQIEIPKSTNSSLCLVNLTEGISQNIIDWASPSTKTNTINDTIVTIMSNTGSKNLNILKNILFQLLIGIYFLIKENIIFDNFSLKNNVYIKRINITIPKIKYWKYIINNVEYFLPNNGYLVMIDSNFKHTNIGLENLNPNVFGNLLTTLPSKFIGPRKEFIDEINKELHKIDDLVLKARNAAAAAAAGAPAAGAPAAGAAVNIDNKEILNKLIDIIVSNFYEYISDDVGKMIDEQELNTNYNKIEGYEEYKPGDLVTYNKNPNYPIISIYKKDKTADKHIIITNKLDMNKYLIKQNNKDDIVNKEITNDLITKITNKSNYNSKEILETYYVN